jgi:hypothetical protein
MRTFFEMGAKTGRVPSEIPAAEALTASEFGDAANRALKSALKLAGLMLNRNESECLA